MTLEFPDLGEHLGEVFQAEVENQQQANEDFRAAAEANRQQVGDVYKNVTGSIARGLMRGKKAEAPELPVEVQEIVNALLAQPRLIPPVQTFLAKKVAEVAAAVDAVLGPMPQEPPQDDPVSS